MTSDFRQDISNVFQINYTVQKTSGIHIFQRKFLQETTGFKNLSSQCGLHSLYSLNFLIKQIKSYALYAKANFILYFSVLVDYFLLTEHQKGFWAAGGGGSGLIVIALC
jgi:hypothetical protein